MNQATFTQRLIAYITDLIVLFILGSLAGSLFLFIPGFWGTVTGTATQPLTGIMLVLYWLGILFLSIGLPFCYFGYLWSQKGQSIGMGMMKIYVVRKADGKNPSFLMAGLRGTIGYYLSSLVFYLGFLWMLFDPQKETWHDKLFSTQVVLR